MGWVIINEKWMDFQTIQTFRIILDNLSIKNYLKCPTVGQYQRLFSGLRFDNFYVFWAKEDRLHNYSGKSYLSTRTKTNIVHESVYLHLKLSSVTKNVVMIKVVVLWHIPTQKGSIVYACSSANSNRKYFVIEYMKYFTLLGY